MKKIFVDLRNAKQSKDLEKAQNEISKLKEQKDKRDDQIKHLRSQKRQVESQGTVLIMIFVADFHKLWSYSDCASFFANF